MRTAFVSMLLLCCKAGETELFFGESPFAFSAAVQIPMETSWLSRHDGSEQALRQSGRSLQNFSIPLIEDLGGIVYDSKECMLNCLAKGKTFCRDKEERDQGRCCDQGD
jgi:hypothetical protein